MFHLVDTFIQRIFLEFTLTQAEALSSASLYLLVATRHDVYIAGTHIHGLRVIISSFLLHLAKN